MTITAVDIAVRRAEDQRRAQEEVIAARIAAMRGALDEVRRSNVETLRLAIQRLDAGDLEEVREILETSLAIHAGRAIGAVLQ